MARPLAFNLRPENMLYFNGFGSGLLDTDTGPFLRKPGGAYDEIK
jgi:hypothetical protein